jgi:transposase
MRYYPSDITREQFEIIKPMLESERNKTKPRKHDLYDIFCAILYVTKGGIQWRMLPSDFPNWQTVYYYFKVWSKTDKDGVSTLAGVLKKISQNTSQL